MIPVVDIFAGPGGLGEGLASLRKASGGPAFRIAVSIEKDENAHATLRLRAFHRSLAGRPCAAYERLRCGLAAWEDLKAEFPDEVAAAEKEALRLELGRAEAQNVQNIIRERLDGSDSWVLVGGPPCQAYSLVGRSRNMGNKSYVAEADERQTLYVEYLQILADHAPTVFVMENVKGLLSAQLNSARIFDRIRDDLTHPALALKRENRPALGTPKYELRALVADKTLHEDDPFRFVVESENFGIPQKRHRVILLGIRTDAIRRPTLFLEPTDRAVTVKQALEGVPRVRSGVSRAVDSGGAWLQTLRNIGQRGWLRSVPHGIRSEVKQVLAHLTVPRLNRGGEVIQRTHDVPLLNHSTRTHIARDLERYLFASVFAQLEGRSPVLAEFPRGLRPRHKNAKRSVDSAPFADRFRVQLADRPSTTITSHISKDGHYYIHFDPTQCRSLTVREAARLQTFPDDYYFCGPRTSQYHQVGNAVPPELARQIGRVVASIVTG